MLHMPPKTTVPSRYRSTARPPPVGKWSAGLYDCGDDPTLCCTVCICQSNATGQLYHRTVGYGCIAISALMWSFFIVTQVLSQTSNALSQSFMRTQWYGGDESLLRAYMIVAGVAGFVGLLSTVVGTYFVCSSRRMLRQRDRIPNGDCGQCDDCCAAYWCGCCSLIQMLRQEGVTGSTYRVCSATAV